MTVRPSTGPFLAWGGVGAGLCLATLTPLTIGILVLPAAVAAGAVLLIWRRSRNGSAVGLLSGVGIVPLYVGYLNRDGPGNVCHTIAGGQECVGEWSPVPWLVLGGLLAACGCALFLWLRARAGQQAA
jgi:hypothetical protein